MYSRSRSLLPPALPPCAVPLCTVTSLLNNSCRTTTVAPPEEKGVIKEMMDHERTEKELEEIFEEIQRSYKTFVEGTLTLQERTLRFARELLESSGGQESEGSQAALEHLAEQGRGQREHFERLARKSSEAYMKVLKGPVDEHHHKVEEAKADLEEASPS